MSTPLAATDALHWLRGFLAGRVGVIVQDDRPEFMHSRLAPVLRQQGLATLPDLADRVRTGDRAVIAGLVDALTTHETSFFRDVDVYGWLEHECLPPLVAQAAGRELLIWSAACSTGQEALSVSMVLLERWPMLSFRVLATDVSAATVARARTGAYSILEVNRGLAARRLAQWFTRRGVEYVVRADLLARIHYDVHNLVERGGPAGPFDLLFLRNVLIYLGESDRDLIFRRLAQVMRPGAVMVLGTAEALIEPPRGLFTRERNARASWLVRTALSVEAAP